MLKNKKKEGGGILSGVGDIIWVELSEMKITD